MPGTAGLLVGEDDITVLLVVAEHLQRGRGLDPQPVGPRGALAEVQRPLTGGDEVEVTRGTRMWIRRGRQWTTT